MGARIDKEWQTTCERTTSGESLLDLMEELAADPVEMKQFERDEDEILRLIRQRQFEMRKKELHDNYDRAMKGV